MKLTAKKTREILKTIHNLKQTLLITDWTIEVAFMADDLDDGTLADIKPDANYKSASLRIYPSLWSSLDYERHLTHELCHCVLAPIADLATERERVIMPEEVKKADESTTSHVAHIICGLRKGGRRG